MNQSVGQSIDLFNSVVSIRGFYSEFWIRFMENRIFAVTISCPGAPLQLYGSIWVELGAEENRVVSMPKLGYSTYSSQSWKFLSRRLKNCSEHHDLCSHDPPWAPSRLIEINGAVLAKDFRSTSADTYKISFRLILTENHRIRGRYVTLSHRWGVGNNIKLTTQTLDAFQSQIPLDQVPQTYVDAAIVTLRLGIRYIWIDSLCIIQNSAQDWDHESAQMGMIYQAGFCNLAATSVQNSQDGLFYNRDPLNIIPHRVYLGKGRQNSVVFRGHRDEEVFAALDREPLNQRGWVCQERLLSTRNISFTRNLVYFECAKELSCEIGDASKVRFRPTNHGFRYPYSLRHIEPRAPETLRLLGRCSSPDAYWRRIVVLYTRCQLTFFSDILVAISAVAKVFHETCQCKYLAGLWERSLLCDLAWCSMYPTRTQDYHAPSWSWASLKSIVNYDLPHQPRALVKFLQTSTSPKGANIFGTVRDGTISLKGFPFPVFSDGLLLDESKVSFCPPTASAEKGVVVKRIKQSLLELCSIPKDYVSLRVSMDHAEIDDGSVYFQLPEGEPLAVLVECFALPLFWALNDEDKLRPTELCLLLLAAATPSMGVYRRIGLCTFGFYGWDMEPRPARDDRDMPEISRLDHGAVVDMSDWTYVTLYAMVERWRRNDAPSHEKTNDGTMITIV